MPSLTDYSLTDFLLFSEETYLATIGYYQQTIWPVQLIAAMLLGYCGWQLLCRDIRRLRLVSLFLAMSWVWLATVYMLNFYGEINWLADDFAVAFILQALALLWLVFLMPAGIAKGSRLSREGQNQNSSECRAEIFRIPFRTWCTGLLLIAFAGVGLPVLQLIQGRYWDQLDFIFITPDSTALMTLGLLIMFSRWLSLATRITLGLIPLLWCLFSLLTVFAFRQM